MKERPTGGGGITRMSRGIRMASTDTVECCCPDMVVERVRGVARPLGGGRWEAWAMFHGPGTDCAKGDDPVVTIEASQSGEFDNKDLALEWLTKMVEVES
jgi:hypothetical protein